MLFQKKKKKKERAQKDRTFPSPPSKKINKKGRESFEIVRNQDCDDDDDIDSEVMIMKHYRMSPAFLS